MLARAVFSGSLHLWKAASCRWAVQSRDDFSAINSLSASSNTVQLTLVSPALPTLTRSHLLNVQVSG